MNPLYEAQHTLQHYCRDAAQMLEQALEEYCNVNLEQDKDSLILNVKKYSSHLVLLEPFYCRDGEIKQASQLRKLCSLLGHEDYLENEEEQIQLLTRIFQEIAQLPIFAKE